MIAPPNAKRKRAQVVFLACGYVCALVVLVNVCMSFGLVRVRIAGISGFSARWAWSAGAAFAFFLAWYTERLGRDTQR